MKETFIQGILAGCLIGLGGCSLLAVNLPIVNALFFAVCLLTIVQLQLKLYTGAIGYLGDGSDWKSLITMYCGNIVGVWGLATIIQSSYLSLSERANDLILNKAYLLTEIPLMDVLIVSIMCGVFVHIAVSVWKNEKVKSEVAKVVITLWAISSFILCGFEHCIADMFYLFVASENVFPLINQIMFIVLITIGNSLGGLLSHNFYKISIDRIK